MANKAEKFKGRRELPEFISVISSNQCARVRIDDIEMIEQEGRRIHVVTAENDYTFYESMKKIAESLADRAFYRPMKGMIINLDHVKNIKGFYVNFYSGQSISMGKNSISRMRSAYKRYLLKYPPYSLYEPIVRREYEAAAESDETDQYEIKLYRALADRKTGN
jgi:hypothetical protein